MPSEVDICNLALQRLGAKSITSLSDDSTNARECNRVYAHARDSELRAHPWSFARTRVQLAASSTAPTFEYARAYPLPSDYIRIIPNNGRLGQNVQDDLQIENGSILSNDSSPLNLTYIRRVTDPNLFDQTFIDLLATRISRDLCEKITQSNTKFQIMQAEYEEAKATARRINAFERPPQESPEDPWITARL